MKIGLEPATLRFPYPPAEHRKVGGSSVASPRRGEGIVELRYLVPVRAGRGGGRGAQETPDQPECICGVGQRDKSKRNEDGSRAAQGRRDRNGLSDAERQVHPHRNDDPREPWGRRQRGEQEPNQSDEVRQAEHGEEERQHRAGEIAPHHLASAPPVFPHLTPVGSERWPSPMEDGCLGQIEHRFS